MSSHIYLAKANNDLICHCQCDNALMTFPPQMDCPWCGCGWLFSCIECRKAFTFATGIVTGESWESLARRDIKNQTGDDPIDEHVAMWVEAMQDLTADIEEGQEYVCLDGALIRTDFDEIRFSGWHSNHDLDFLPQVQALSDNSIVDDLLANMDYWESRKVAEEDQED